MTAANDGPAERTDPFSVLTVAALIGTGIIAFCAFLVLAAYAPDISRDRAGGTSALSNSAVGFAGLVALVKELGTPVSIRRTDPALTRGSLLILTPRGPSMPRDLMDHAATPTLVVLPKWTVEADPAHPGWVANRGAQDLALVTAALPVPIDLYRRPDARDPVLHGGDGPLSQIVGIALVPISDLQLIDTSARAWSPVLLTEAGETVLARYTAGQGQPVYVLSDPDLLDTHGLKSLETARAAVAVLDGLRGGTPIVFDMTLDGFGRSPNLLRLLFEPPLLGATVCAAAASLLILAMAFRRFGPTVPPPRVHDFGKRSLADNAAALIGLAGRERRMAMPYADLIRTVAMRRIGIPLRTAHGEADRLIEAAGRARGMLDTFAALARRASDAASRSEALDAALRLHRWSEGLRHDGR